MATIEKITGKTDRRKTMELKVITFHSIKNTA